MAHIKDMKFDHLIGQQAGSAVLLKELARGGMAVIFVAYQKTLRRQIAVKVLPKSLINPRVADRFQQEAESAAILSHPNIVPIYEVGDTGDFLFFTMQLIKGRPLSDYIFLAQKNVLPSKRILPLGATIKIIINILDALDYAHSQDIIHRDIKPANILIESHTKRPIITDFGIAALTRGSNLKQSTIVGTPIYMAPEQVTGDHMGGHADIYSTGVMLFEMLVGGLPLPKFRSGKELLLMKLQRKDDLFLKKPSEMNSKLDRKVDTIVSKAISFDLEKRYANCREFSQDLETYLDHILRKRV